MVNVDFPQSAHSHVLPLNGYAAPVDHSTWEIHLVWPKMQLSLLQVVPSLAESQHMTSKLDTVAHGRAQISPKMSSDSALPYPQSFFVPFLTQLHNLNL